MKYVVEWREHLCDGEETGARIVATIKEAEELMSKLRNGFAGDSLTFCVFELGKGIPLIRHIIQEDKRIVKEVVEFKLQSDTLN